MSYRGHLAAGWGLTPDQFMEYSNDEGKDLYSKFDSLYNRLSKEQSLVIPYSDFQEVDDNTKWGSNHLIEADLLQGGLDPNFGWPKDRYLGIAELKMRKDQHLKSVSDLFTSVMDPDNLNLILFYPDARWKDEMFRYDNMLDLCLASFPLESETRPQNPLYDKIQEQKFNPYPYTNGLMNKETGEAEPWDYFTRLEKRTDWAPAPPKQLIWWLNKHNVLKDNSWIKLRPYICRWFC